VITHANTPILTMKHVERLALKTLRNCKLQATEDTVNEVMSAIWSAYTRFNPNKRSKLLSWLIHCARCKIKTLRSKKKGNKPKMISLDNNFYSREGKTGSWHDLLGEVEFDRLELDEIINYAKSGVFSQQQQQIFERHYVGGEDISDIAADLGIQRTCAYQMLESMMKKLRWRFNT